MLDESQGLLQEGNLSRYSGPLSVCVPLAHSCICPPLGGASPQDGHLYRPPHCWSLIHIESNRLGPSHLRPPTSHLPVSISFCVGLMCLVSIPLTPLSSPWAPHWPSSSQLIRCAILTRPPPPFTKKMLKRVSSAPGARELCLCSFSVSCGSLQLMCHH